ncbi:MAG: hypothetical protein V4721_10090 [Bacteroidota bacterium]
MKKRYWLVVTALLVSLFIYVFYRTEKTVVNEMLLTIISRDTFFGLRKIIINVLPLNEHLIYSLPEGLWVFCITFTSKHLFLKLAGRAINLVFVPLVFSIGLELFQLLRLTNGRFDFWDIGASIVFWTIANYSMIDNRERQNVLSPFNYRSLILIASYLIVYLAHVFV